MLYADRVSIVYSIKSITFVLNSVWSLDLETACTFFGLCIVPAFSVLLGVLLFFDYFSCRISLLSRSNCSPFEVNIWLLFELLLDGILPELTAAYFPHYCYWDDAVAVFYCVWTWYAICIWFLKCSWLFNWL